MHGRKKSLIWKWAHFPITRKNFLTTSLLWFLSPVGGLVHRYTQKSLHFPSSKEEKYRCAVLAPCSIRSLLGDAAKSIELQLLFSLERESQVTTALMPALGSSFWAAQGERTNAAELQGINNCSVPPAPRRIAALVGAALSKGAELRVTSISQLQYSIISARKRSVIIK